MTKRDAPATLARPILKALLELEAKGNITLFPRTGYGTRGTVVEDHIAAAVAAHLASEAVTERVANAVRRSVERGYLSGTIARAAIAAALDANGGRAEGGERG